MSINDFRLYGSKKANDSIDLSDSEDPEVQSQEVPVEEPVVEEEPAAEPEPEDDTFEAEKAAATAAVPTSATKKEDIRAYLMYQHGVDPSDMQDMTKADLLSLVDDLEA
jgi:hypothetical protein